MRYQRTGWSDIGEVDMCGWMARTTLEMLGHAGLGYSLDDFQKYTSDYFGESLKDLL